MAPAYEGRPFEWHDLWTEWVWDPAISVPLALAAALYWRGSGRAVGVSRAERWCFWSGWAVLVVSLLSPLHPMGEVLFSAHMVQHELMMVVAAPLLVMGRPVVVWLWALPLRTRQRAGVLAKGDSFAIPWRVLTTPHVAFAVHFAVIWVWHLPRAYNTSVTNSTAHALQHASFLVSALLFWWTVMRVYSGRRHLGPGLFYVFATATHTCVLGALLTFWNMPLYAAYTLTAPDWGLTPLEDQQLGGLIMWVPPGFVYLGIFLAMFASWLKGRDAGIRTSSAPLALLAMCFLLSSCGDPDPNFSASELVPGADPARGRSLLQAYGCVTCHVIPGVAGATGTVGPPLNAVGRRTYLAGRITNTPDNMTRWISNPKSVDDQTAMPVTGISADDARHVAAYLYTLR
jgi:cytochrome c oxidase assembly factor CtaG/cytochrome c2